MKSTICASDDDAKMTGFKCSFELFKSLMSLTRSLNVAIKLMVNLPFDTEACFLDATKEIISTYENFVPNIKTCMNDM